MDNIIIKKTGQKSIKEIKTEEDDDKLQDLKHSQNFKNAIDLFPDLEVVNVKDLKDK